MGRRLDPLLETHTADGYASDDDYRPRTLPQGYGALPGDLPERQRVSGDAAVAYHVRQASSGTGRSRKVKFLDAVLSRPPGQRPAPAQTQVRMSAIERHRALLHLLPAGPSRAFGETPKPKNDLQLLKESHRFLRTEADEDGSWEARLARRYYDRLFREYVICDLAGYRTGDVGFRWRIETEVVRGKGQFYCGHKPCNSKIGLRSYEVDFKYREHGEGKRALVKVRLCEKCAYKLHYKRLKAERKRQRKQKDVIQIDDDHSEEDVCAKHARRARCEIQEEQSMPPGADRTGRVRADTEDVEEGERELSDTDKKRLEALAWRGPDPEARTRQDDFDDYFNDLFL